MDQIIVRLLQGRATRDEEEALLRWRRAHRENERRYREVVELWGSMEDAAPADPPREAPSAFEIIRLARDRARVEPGEPPARRGEWRRRGTRAAAAVALLLLGYGAASLRGARPLLAGGVVATSAGERATVTLDDGSVVRLGPATRLRVAARADRREVHVEGRAFFSVAPDGERPFTVRTRAGEAVVLGTRFQVQASGTTLRLVVLDGRVAVTAGQERRELGGGEVGEVVDGGLVVREVENAASMLRGLGNFLAFRSTPLRSVAGEIEAHFGIPVEIRDPVLAGRTVTAAFQDATFEEVLSVVCRVTGSPCTITEARGVVGSDTGR